MSPSRRRDGKTLEVRMFRLLVVLAFTGIGVSSVCAKDLCIQVDTGSFSGSQIVLRKVRITAGTAAPLQGYFAIYSSGTFSYVEFNPLDGASVVNSAGNVTALGL